MGFFNSLKGQVGRDTGRVISNFFFGNRHATKYERIDNSGEIKLARIDKERDKIKLAEVKTKLKHEENIVDTKIKHEIFLIENQILSNEKDYTRTKISELTKINVPQKKESIIDNLHSLSVSLSANSNFWDTAEDEKQKITNSLSDAILTQYYQHLFALKVKYPKAIEINHFEKQYNKYKRQAFLQKYKLVFIGILLAIVCGIGMYFEKDKPKETPIKDFFKSLTEK